VTAPSSNNFIDHGCPPRAPRLTGHNHGRERKKFRIPVIGYRSCPHCGTAVQAARLAAGGHDCPPHRYVEHQTLLARDGRERLEEDLARWLRTPDGRFALYRARRLR
jgi:hypothetical protein